MKRLAIFAATSGHSGVDRVIANLAPAIAKRGIAVDILHVRGHGPHVDAESHENLRVVDLGSRHALTAISPLMRYLRNVQPDTLLTDKDRVNRVAIVAHLLTGSGARLVVRTGTTISINLAQRRPLDRWINYLSMRYLYGHADAIILPSTSAANDFAATVKVNQRRVTVCPSPIDTPELHERAAEPVDARLVPPGDGPLIVGVGELSARKEYATAVRAFARLDPERQARLVILGEGRKRQELERLARELGVAERVRLPGFVRNPYPVLSIADVFIHTASLEGFGLAVMEAVALGRPVVSTDCPSGPHEILGGGRYGGLVDVGDDIAMSEAVATMLDEPPSSAFIRTAARNHTLTSSMGAYLKALSL